MASVEHRELCCLYSGTETNVLVGVHHLTPEQQAAVPAEGVS